MSGAPIRFEDGAAYEFYMGRWSRLVGPEFLDWLSPSPGLAWVDVGCGNGAFTELVAQRCAPARLEGIDPSEGQIRYASGREGTRPARFQVGNAMALPFADSEFDIAVMALVLFFVPDPAQGVREMCRVVRPGGRVAAYLWDFEGGGFPLEVMRRAMGELGHAVATPPNPWVSAAAALRDTWKAAGLQSIEERRFTVQRTFERREEYWEAVRATSSRSVIDGLSDAERQRLRARVDELLPANNPDGTLTLSATANAISGLTPA